MNNEIKVMNNDEIRDFCIKKDLKIFELEQELQQKEKIIKEVREKIKELANLYDDNYTVSDKAKDILEILEGEE